MIWILSNGTSINYKNVRLGVHIRHFSYPQGTQTSYRCKSAIKTRLCKYNSNLLLKMIGLEILYLWSRDAHKSYFGNKKVINVVLYNIRKVSNNDYSILVNILVMLVSKVCLFSLCGCRLFFVFWKARICERASSSQALVQDYKNKLNLLFSL